MLSFKHYRVLGFKKNFVCLRFLYYVRTFTNKNASLFCLSLVKLGAMVDVLIYLNKKYYNQLNMVFL